MDGEKYNISCDFCLKDVHNREFWIIERWNYWDTTEDGKVPISVLDKDNDRSHDSLKYQSVICQNCVMKGKYKEIGFH